MECTSKSRLSKPLHNAGLTSTLQIIAGNLDDDYLNQFCDGVPADQLTDFRSKVHDQVLSICPRDQVVTLATIRGFSFSKSVLYLVADGSDPVPATIDGGTYAKRLAAIRTGDDDALFSGIERFFVCTNGFTNKDVRAGGPHNESHHPWRQGLNSAVLGEGNALNILGKLHSCFFAPDGLLGSSFPVLCPQLNHKQVPFPPLRTTTRLSGTSSSSLGRISQSRMGSERA